MIDRPDQFAIDQHIGHSAGWHLMSVQLDFRAIETEAVCRQGIPELRAGDPMLIAAHEAIRESAFMHPWSFKAELEHLCAHFIVVDDGLFKDGGGRNHAERTEKLGIDLRQRSADHAIAFCQSADHSVCIDRGDLRIAAFPADLRVGIGREQLQLNLLLLPCFHAHALLTQLCVLQLTILRRACPRIVELHIVTARRFIFRLCRLIAQHMLVCRKAHMLRAVKQADAHLFL